MVIPIGVGHTASRSPLFLCHQLLINSVAWTAGLIAAGLVASLFELRGLRNLWDLAASGSRTLVSARDYRLIMALTSFCAGLLMMIVVRQFILRWIDEIRSLRLERMQGRLLLRSAEFVEQRDCDGRLQWVEEGTATVHTRSLRWSLGWWFPALANLIHVQQLYP